MIILFYLALIRALLDRILCPGVSFPPYNPVTRKLLTNWDKLSGRPPGLQHVSCKERVRELNLFDLEKGGLATI